MAERVLKDKAYTGKPGPLCGHCTYKDNPEITEGRGGPTGGWMIISQGPGEADAKAKRWLAGSTRARLIRQLGKANILLENCWLDAVVRCVMPKTRAPTKTAMRCCRPMLEKSMAMCKPHTIITLGASALEAFYPGGKIATYHGTKIQADGYLLVPMYQPNAYDDNPDLLRTLAMDYASFRKRPTLQVACGSYSLSQAAWPTINNDRFSIDTETTGLEVNCGLLGMSFSDTPGTASYTPAERLRRQTRLEGHAVMHNAKFDLTVLEYNGIADVDEWEDVDDTMLLAYCMSKKPLGLKPLVTQELNVEMIKFKDLADEDDSLAGLPPEEVAEYACGDADCTLQLWNRLWKNASHRERKLYDQIEKPLPRIMAKARLKGVLVDVPYFERLSRELGAKLELKFAEMKRLCPTLELETLTSPTQLAKFLSALLKKHIPATDKFAMEKLKTLHPVMPMILDFRSLYKLKGSFVDSLLALQRGGLVYPDFNQTGTGTGRWSCSKPNLQQLPKRTDKTVRQGFVAPEGFVVCSIDNSQIDLRSLAYLSQDFELNKVFREHRDAHDEAAKLLKGDDGETARRVAKTANFLTVFGGGEDALAMKADVPLQVAHDFLEAHRQKHPGIYEWVDDTHKSLIENGFVETAYGRRRYIPKVYTGERGAALREGQNMPVQGTSGDVLKLQLAAAARICLPFSQVHDELDFYLPKKGAMEMARELVRAMEGVECPFELKVEAAMGPNLGEMKEVSFE